MKSRLVLAAACLFVGVQCMAPSNAAEPASVDPFCEPLHETSEAMVLEMSDRGVPAIETSIYRMGAESPDIRQTIDVIAEFVEMLHGQAPDVWIPPLIRLTCTHGADLGPAIIRKAPLVARQCGPRPDGDAVDCALRVVRSEEVASQPVNDPAPEMPTIDWSEIALSRPVEDWIKDFRKGRISDWLPVASSPSGLLEMQLSSFRGSEKPIHTSNGNQSAMPKPAVSPLRNFGMRVRNVDTDAYVLTWLHVLECDERTYQMQQYKEFNEHGVVTSTVGASDVEEVGAGGNFHVLYKIACARD